MRRITFLTGTFILGLMATEKANAMMEVAPSSKPAVREERKMPLVTPPQEEITPNPKVFQELEGFTPPPETHQKKASTKHHRPTAGSPKPLPYLPTLEEQMKHLCQKRGSKDLEIAAMTSACEALGCSNESPSRPCDLTKK